MCSRPGLREEVHHGGDHLAHAASRPLHGSSQRSARTAALRSSWHGEDPAGQGDRQHVPLHLLQHQRLLADEQVDGRGREDGARAVRHGGVQGGRVRAWREMQPSVIFIDEIDSLLSMRRWGRVGCVSSRDDDMEGTRRIKTEFLVQLDGITSAKESGNILVIGATNRPQDLDEAARRRFVKRLYIPLPDAETRRSLFTILLKKNDNTISDAEVDELTRRSEGYSCADIHNLCREAAMGPIRDISVNNSIVEMNVSVEVGRQG